MYPGVRADGVGQVVHDDGDPQPAGHHTAPLQLTVPQDQPGLYPGQSGRRERGSLKNTVYTLLYMQLKKNSNEAFEKP